MLHAELESEFSTQFSFSNFLCRNVDDSTCTRVLSLMSRLLSYCDVSVTYELYALTFLNCLNCCLESCVDNLSC